MFKKLLFLTTFILGFSTNLSALNDIDKFILNHGVSDCNGESPNCNDFYTRAVELNDDRNPTSFEIRF